jgi:UDP-N-acetylmuramoyl-L-alanyl-D-glutamate--2,6-diaminopimelate ligase
MIQAGCRYAVIETSSQGIVQSRHIGIHYDVVAFTNLTPEHIEAHGGFAHYQAAKGRLFEELRHLPGKRIDDRDIEKTIVVNLDDPYASYFLSFQADRYGGCSWRGVQPELFTRLNTTPVLATEALFERTCTLFKWNGKPVHFKPIGRFYLENALLATAVVSLLGVEQEVLRRGIETLEAVPGRLEKIDEGQPFMVMVDYAYEPAALSAVYETLDLLAYARLIHVVGSAGGGRDVARRKILGEMAASHDDIVIVTNEDPYDDDPMQIVNDVADAAGASGKMDGVDLYRILDRQEAIDFAIKIAQPDDLVLLTGKGSEPVMAVANGQKIPWDDRVAVRRAFINRYGST